MKKIALAAVAAVVLGTAALSSPAEARCWWNGYAMQCWHHPHAWWWRHHHYWGPYAWHHHYWGPYAYWRY